MRKPWTKNKSQSHTVYTKHKLSFPRSAYKTDRKRKRKFLPKKWTDQRAKGTHKHMEAWLKCFDDHRCLSRSKQNKCMWKHGKDSVTWEFWKRAVTHLVVKYWSLLLKSFLLYSNEVYMILSMFCWKISSSSH